MQRNIYQHNVKYYVTLSIRDARVHDIVNRRRLCRIILSNLKEQ